MNGEHEAELGVITGKDANGIVTVSLKGIIDAYTYNQLEEVFNRLVAESNYKFIVDLSQVDYISSAGAGVFISMHALVQENNGNIIFVNPTLPTRNLFELLGLNHIFTITEDLGSALSAFSTP